MKYNFVVTKTPLRISFFGGGTDFKKYYKQKKGMVISTTINKYIYVTVKTQNFFFSENYRLNYSSTERVNNINDIKNKIIKACLEFTKIKNKLYISTVSDIPGSTGLGSSSAFTIGLLKALFRIKGIKKNNLQIAKIAAYIEIKILKAPIGFQDQYSCAVGGFNTINFFKNEKVAINKLEKYISINKILSKSALVWTGIYKNSNLILKGQNNNINKNIKFLDEILKIAQKISIKIKKKNLSEIDFKNSLKKSWILKKKLSNKISNSKIDKMIKTFSKFNIGFKLLGAGGGGFIFIYGSESKKVLKKIKIKFLNIKPAFKGSQIIYEEKIKK